MHYQRHRRGVSLELPARVVNKDELCNNSECSNDALAKGLCRRCYRKVEAWGDPNYGKTKGKYQKKKKANPSGYIVWYDPKCVHANSQGWVYEHRYVMGEHIGRRLTKEENVHHLNGDRSDNRLDNLELWSTKQPPGQRVKDKVQWAREILELYVGLEKE